MMEFIITGKIKPAVRMTRKGKWVNPEALEYLASQQAIAWQFREQCPEMLPARTPLVVTIEIETPKPFTGDIDNWGLNLSLECGIMSLPRSKRDIAAGVFYFPPVAPNLIPFWRKSASLYIRMAGIPRHVRFGLGNQKRCRGWRFFVSSPDLTKGDSVMCESWTQEEIDFLKENYLRLEHQEIGRILNRTSNSVRGKCWDLRLRKKAAEWSPAHIELLKQYYANEIVDLESLALAVGRHKTNVSRKARELGLTSPYRPASKEEKKTISIKAKKRIAEDGHPRGYLGHTHSKETRRLIGKKSIETWRNPKSKFHTEEFKQRKSDHMAELQRQGKVRQAYSRGNQGKREDLDGLYVRSSWEANYARYLNWLIQIGEIKNWEYESKTFEFTEIKRGSRFYTPDFTITNNDDSIEYHEIKGWMDQKSQTKLKRMKKYFPHVKLILIDAEAYKALAKDVKRFILYWE